jgi:hypothetical protein
MTAAEAAERIELVVLGDFHMAAGRDPLSGDLDAREPFLNDAAFARFLEHLLHQAKSSRRAAVHLSSS